MEGVRAAMVIPPGATSSLDLEKRDRKMAKVVIDIVGLEPEKYRLGYTKVKRALCYRVNAASSPKGFFFLFIALFRLLFFSVRCRRDAIHCPSFDTWPF